MTFQWIGTVTIVKAREIKSIISLVIEEYCYAKMRLMNKWMLYSWFPPGSIVGEADLPLVWVRVHDQVPDGDHHGWSLPATPLPPDSQPVPAWGLHTPPRELLPGPVQAGGSGHGAHHALQGGHQPGASTLYVQSEGVIEHGYTKYRKGTSIRQAPVFRHLRALRKSPWKFIIWMTELWLHCMLLISYIQQYFNTSITVLTNQVWKLPIALLKVLNTGAFTVLANHSCWVTAWQGWEDVWTFHMSCAQISYHNFCFTCKAGLRRGQYRHHYFSVLPAISSPSTYS